MKITKNMESKYFKGVDEKQLNCREGYRVINVKFEDKEDFINEYAGEEYIIAFEKFLNTECNLDYFMEDGSRSVVANIAEVSFCVLEEDIKNFNNWYKIFKNTYKYEILKQREELESEKELELTDLETLENLEDENFGYTESEIAKLEEKCGFLDSEEIENTMNGLQDELESKQDIMSKEQLYTNIENLVNNHDFDGIIGFYDKGEWLTEVRDRGSNILFVVDEKLSIYLNKDEEFSDKQGWIDFIKDNA